MLFLDAIEAFQRNDYRHCILYVAIAVEALANSAVLKRFDQYRRRHQSARHLRLLQIPQSHGATIRKDPVFDRLAAADKFKVLLHELPLYVFRRSLLIEKKPLHDVALRLYDTRNSIVHNNQRKQMAHLLPISFKGAFTALECGRDLFQWFGVKRPFVLPFPITTNPIKI